MLNRFFLFFFVVGWLPAFSQKMQIAGNVQDTAAKEPLAGAVAMAVRLSDSTLVQYTRSDKSGTFLLKDIPLDTYQVVISHPRFSDQVFIVLGSEKNSIYDFGRIVLPLKSQQLNEIVVYAFKDPIYYRGDTLVYTADSFKVKPNATVEDLLKRLPGIKVDANGKITTQGKSVDQVLVDGDEFFGSDPTVATRNLNASAIESVQVYDKKTEANSSSTSDNETTKVMNLKLKEDAKKGYFGKVSGAGGSSDLKFTKQFYEGEFLANKFNNKRKISAFALAGNTPKTNIGFGDMFRYGITGDITFDSNDDGMIMFNGGGQTTGIPQTLKGGAYYTDKLGKNTKLLFNYTYGSSQVTTSSTTRNQYFLTDTTYTTSNESYTNQQGQNHIFNFSIEQNLDSLTKITIKPKITLGQSSNDHSEKNQFITETDTLTRQTVINNNTKGTSYEVENTVKLRRDFKKPDRVLKVDYDFNLDHSEGKGTLKTTNTYFAPISFPVADVNQQKTNATNGLGHDASLSFIEPFTKKIKLELMLDFVMNKSTQDKKTLNYANGDYTIKDSVLSNNFENIRTTYRAGLKFIYEKKKLRFSFGSRVREVLVNNYNFVTTNSIHQDISNVLPFMSWRYKFSDNENFSFNYFTGSSLPSITQLQPVPNNNNPNYITLGNPNLVPSYQHHFELNYNSYKPISGKVAYGGANFNVNNNDFSSSTTYDNIGRTITQPINVNGNMSGDGWLGVELPFFSKVLSVDPTINGDYYSNTNYINGQKNITTNISASGDLKLRVNTDKISFSVSGNYQYNVPKSTLNSQSNKPYATQGYEAELSWELPWKLSVSTDAEYVINTKRTAGYNISYVLWNMTLNKKFLANENLILGLSGNDILNQNISATRTVRGNIITDNKTTIIKRYIMVRLTWKFNSQKKKDDNEWGD
jgi:hypothetical protein